MLYMSRMKPPTLQNLPPTDSNLQLHVLRANIKMMIWKASDQWHPTVDARDISRFTWDVQEGGVVTPYVSNAPVAPHGLLDVVSCSCSAERNACSEKSYRQLSQCWTFLYGVVLLRRGDACCSPFNKHTVEYQLAEYMQENERQADDDE